MEFISKRKVAARDPFVAQKALLRKYLKNFKIIRFHFFLKIGVKFEREFSELGVRMPAFVSRDVRMDIHIVIDTPLVSLNF